jgi:hypothetical protein
MGDNKLETFLSNWESVLSGMATEPDDQVKQLLFLEQLRPSAALRMDINHYDKLEPGAPDRSYAYLHRAVRRRLERERDRENRKSVACALTQAHGNAPASPPLAHRRGGSEGKGQGSGGRQ